MPLSIFKERPGVIEGSDHITSPGIKLGPSHGALLRLFFLFDDSLWEGPNLIPSDVMWLIPQLLLLIIRSHEGSARENRTLLITNFFVGGMRFARLYPRFTISSSEGWNLNLGSRSSTDSSVVVLVRSTVLEYKVIKCFSFREEAAESSEVIFTNELTSYLAFFDLFFIPKIPKSP
ncbi:unnamed protein product [Prunus armeniaca]|uniref:Uncharacterized protein n=1 Tax=Prunus armeniaca TaxID=36596 RepID=A0A6J5VUZ1_PRUAR|nr:unnamed protein product [Prunus armeniaca]